nr:ornithine cyclodeaminase family protein [Tissierella sp.]
MNIIILKESDIKEIFSMKDAIKASKDALELYSKGESDIPLRVNIDVPEENGQSLYMPGYVSGARALGVKIVSTYPDNSKIGLETISSMMVMKDSATGEINAIMDGNYLTKLRTGAVSGAATDLLARKDAKIFALIGTGGQARTQLEAILNVRAIQEVRVSGRDKEKGQKFADAMMEEFGQAFNVSIKFVENSDEAIDGADIITTATTSPRPVFDGRLVKKGAHINGVGSFTPTMQEIDPYTLNHAEKIYLDTRDGVLNECGDFIIPIESGEFSKDKITGELGEAIAGKIKSRENDEEITLFNTVGSAVLDLVTAKRIYDKAVKEEKGSRIDL